MANLKSSVRSGRSDQLSVPMDVDDLESASINVAPAMIVMIKAARCIQAVVRGNKGRVEATQTRTYRLRQDAAATHIQAAVRGTSTRVAERQQLDLASDGDASILRVSTNALRAELEGAGVAPLTNEARHLLSRQFMGRLEVVLLQNEECRSAGWRVLFKNDLSGRVTYDELVRHAIPPLSTEGPQRVCTRVARTTKRVQNLHPPPKRKWNSLGTCWECAGVFPQRA